MSSPSRRSVNPPAHVAATHLKGGAAEAPQGRSRGGKCVGGLRCTPPTIRVPVSGEVSYDTDAGAPGRNCKAQRPGREKRQRDGSATGEGSGPARRVPLTRSAACRGCTSSGDHGPPSVRLAVSPSPPVELKFQTAVVAPDADAITQYCAPSLSSGCSVELATRGGLF